MNKDDLKHAMKVVSNLCACDGSARRDIAHYFGVVNFNGKWPQTHTLIGQANVSGRFLLDIGNGVRMWFTTGYTQVEFTLYNSLYAKVSRGAGKHRLYVRCPHCKKNIPVGRFRQHAKRKDHIL